MGADVCHTSPVVSDSVIKHRRAVGMAIASAALVCASLALIDAFDLAEVPGGKFFAAATWLLIAATWIYLEVSGRWRSPRVTATEKWYQP